MPGPNHVLDKGFQPTAATPRFTAVILAATKEKVTPAGADALAIGICQEEITAADATAGRVADIRMMGISRCVAAAAIAIGDRVKVAANGKVTSTGLVAGNPLVGVAMEAAAADNDHIDVFLTPGVKF